MNSFLSSLAKSLRGMLIGHQSGFSWSLHAGVVVDSDKVQEKGLKPPKPS